MPAPAPHRPIFIGVAWPYANGEQHIGHIAGAYLPPDIFARYHRMAGNQVLMVSGSDAHGTPITVRADEEGISPAEVVERYHPRFIASYERLGITFDLFTHTDTQNHWDTTQDFFRTHREKGYLTIQTQQQIYDPQKQTFLPDRYVEGTCPRCGYDKARGDQCDNCGATYEAVELKNPRSKVSGSQNLEVRESEHFFLELGKLNEDLVQWFNSEDRSHWRTAVANYTKSEIEARTLRGRPITRDMNWGITIPEPGFEGKRIYVWYDAVIGYFAAAKEWAALSGSTDSYKTFWDKDSRAQSFYFIGKDNIPFHTIIWPAMLLGYGGLKLPYDVPANEYLNIKLKDLKGEKFSKSKGLIISIADVLERYQPDAWRYALTSLAPETGDVDFSWADFVERVNNELLANWGNLCNRVLGFAFKRFEGKVPTPGAMEGQEAELLEAVKAGFGSVSALYEARQFRAASRELLRLSQRVNQYITDRAPFKVVKEDPALAGTMVYAALQAIDWLKVLWAPILPHSSQRLHELLGYEGQLFGRQYTQEVQDARGKHLVLRYDHAGALGHWEATTLAPGQALREPAPLFVKLEEELIQREAEAMEASAAAAKKG